MCGGGLRRPSDGWIGNKEGFRRVILRKIVVLFISIFVILKNIDGALFRESGVRPSPEKAECNQGA
jgi:hypothetical protein